MHDFHNLDVWKKAHRLKKKLDKST